MVPVFDNVMLPALPTIDASDPKVIRPANVATLLLEFVSAPAPKIPVPLRVNALAFVMVMPFKSRAAPLTTLTALLDAPKAAELSSFKVPALIVVPPV